MQKDNKKLKQVFISLLLIVGGGVVGYFVGGVMPENGSIMGNGLIGFVVFMLLVFIAFFVHIIVHELGHLVAGKLSGYTFVSFRVGSLMLMKQQGQWKMKQYTLPGTAGQCLMRPPSEDGGSYPYKFYNAGGVIGNLSLSLVAAVVYVLLPIEGWLQMGCLLIVIVGTLLAITNGIPMTIDGMPNDGSNMRVLGESREARHAFWLQLEIHGRLAEGEGIENMPSNYFEVEQKLDLNNPLVFGIFYYECVYLHSKGMFQQARERSQYLVDSVPNMIRIYKNELQCELLFYELIDECRQEKIEAYYTKELSDYITITKSFISKKRLMYTYYLLAKEDIAAAERERKDFEKVTKTYPYQGEIENERKILEKIVKIHETRRNDNNV